MAEKKYTYIGDVEGQFKRLSSTLYQLGSSGCKLYTPTKKRYTDLSIDVINNFEQFFRANNIPLHVEVKQISSEIVERPAKQMMHDILVQMSNLESIVLPSRDMEVCKSLILEWFNARFGRRHEDRYFRYNLAYFNRWLDWFIIALGQYIHEGRIDEFRESLYDWINEEMTQPGKDGITYPLPFFIKNIGELENNITAESIVIEHDIKPILYTLPDYISNQITILSKWQMSWGVSYDIMIRTSKIR